MAGTLSPATRERIRAASDIVDVIGSYLPLKKAGANFTALCPFHKEKTPSFNVNPHKQIFHCFGCHKGGDVFTFVKEYENIGFMDAVRRLAERAKIPLEFDQNPAEQQSRHIKDQLLQIHEQIAQRWQNCLLNEAAGQTARDYLAKRGVSPEAVKLFRLGAAPDAWDDTVNWAKSKSHDFALVEKAGLILRKEGGEHFYDRFRGRLIFPICDEQGRVIGFSGRVLSGDEKTAKYVNSPETPIFTKSRVFFGLDKSKRAILDAGFAVVCEGQLDLIACFMGGVQNIVAPQGTAFTEQHARIIKRYVDEVVLCFDSDEAGQNAAVRSLDHLLASGLAVRVAVVPAPHDPDSFIKANGGEAFRQLVENAEGFFDFYLNRLCMENNLKDDKGRLSVVRSMLEVLQKTDSLVIIDRYALKIALKLNLPHASIKNEFLKLKPASNLRTENVSEEIEKVIPPTIQEKWLVKLLLQDEIKFEWVKSHLDLNWIQSSFIRKIITSWIDFRNKNVGVFHLGLWLNDLGESARNFITEMLADSRKIPSPEGQLNTLVTTFRNKFLDQQLRSLNEQEHDENLSHSQKVELLREQQKLREQKRAPLT